MDEVNDTDVDKSSIGEKGAQAAAGSDIVVIAIDGSKQSEDAFDWYFKFLHRDGNSVIVVHAQEVPMMPTRDSWENQMHAGNKKKEEIQERFRLKFQAHGMINGRFISGFEKPGQFILDTARKENASYLVMGRRGQGKIRRTVLGSVSDFVLHHIHCPIIISRT